MDYTNLKDAKKAANKKGWMVGVTLTSKYYIISPRKWNESLGYSPFVSKKAQAYFIRKHKRSIRSRLKRIRAVVRFYKKQAKETAKKELTAVPEPHTIIPCITSN